jgi:hypothetical protein
MPRNSLQNVDPTIRSAAASLIVEGMNAIESAMLAGMRFHTARDAYLADNVDSWVNTCGRDCADQALRGLCALEESEVLSREAKSVLDRRWKADRLNHLATRDTGRNTWINRAWTRVFGIPLYALILAVVSFSAVHSSPAAAVEVAPRFKALALCGTLKPGPARDRACAPFNSVQRGAYRDWDAGPRGPAPREWELPKPYEIDPWR